VAQQRIQIQHTCVRATEHLENKNSSSFFSFSPPVDVLALGMLSPKPKRLNRLGAAFPTLLIKQRSWFLDGNPQTQVFLTSPWLPCWYLTALASINISFPTTSAREGLGALLKSVHPPHSSVWKLKRGHMTKPQLHALIFLRA